MSFVLGTVFVISLGIYKNKNRVYKIYRTVYDNINTYYKYNVVNIEYNDKYNYRYHNIDKEEEYIKFIK